MAHYLVHVSWIDRQFQKHHMLLWLSDTLVTAAHTGDYSPSCCGVRSGIWVGLGWVTPVQKIMGLVWLDPFAVGLG